MARKRGQAAEAVEWDLEEHQRTVIRLFMRQRGFSAARLGPLVGMSGNAFGLRVQEDWTDPDSRQPVFKPVQLLRLMKVLGITDANLLFRPAKLALVPDYGPEDPDGGSPYNLYYHGDSVVPSRKPVTKQRIPA